MVLNLLHKPQESEIKFSAFIYTAAPLLLMLPELFFLPFKCQPFKQNVTMNNLLGIVVINNEAKITLAISKCLDKCSAWVNKKNSFFRVCAGQREIF